VLKNYAGYIVNKLGCVSPFFISRVLVLSNWKALEDMGAPLVKFRVSGFKAGFYIEGLKDILEDECFQKNEERKCIEALCDFDLPEDKRKIVDEILERVRSLNEVELNRLVINDPRYKEMLEKGGFS